MSLKGRRVLVVRNDRIGDLVLALPLVQGLKEAGAVVGLWASPYTAALLKADPRVDVLIEDGPNAAEALRAGRFDTALLLWATGRNAWKALAAGIPLRVGPSARPASLLFNRRLALRRSQGWEHESELNYEFGRAIGLAGPVPPPRLQLGLEAKSQAKRWLKSKGPKGDGPLVVLHPGSKGSAQPWPADRFAELGRELKARHGARLLVSGGPGDEAAMDACARALPGALRYDASLDLASFAALLGQADLFVAASTGPLHLAAAQGVPVLGLYPPLRPMSPLRWAPRGSRRAVLSPVGLGFRVEPKAGVNFTARISVQEAAAAAEFLLRKERSR